MQVRAQHESERAKGGSSCTKNTKLKEKARTRNKEEKMKLGLAMPSRDARADKQIQMSF